MVKKLADLLSEELQFSTKAKQKKLEKHYDGLLKEHLYNIRKDLRKFIINVSKDVKSFNNALSINESHKVANVVGNELHEKIKKWSGRELNEINYLDALDDLSALRSETTNKKIVELADSATKTIDSSVVKLEEYFGRDWEDMLYSCSEDEHSWAQNTLRSMNNKTHEHFSDLSTIISSKKTSNKQLLREHYSSIANKYEYLIRGFPESLKLKLLENSMFFVQVKKAMTSPEKINSLVLDYLDL